MSVGLQRLRAEPDLLRRACIDKGIDPSVVDRALVVDTRYRRLQAESLRLHTERRQAARAEGERQRRIRQIDAELAPLLARISSWFDE